MEHFIAVANITTRMLGDAPWTTDPQGFYVGSALVMLAIVLIVVRIWVRKAKVPLNTIVIDTKWIAVSLEKYEYRIQIGVLNDGRYQLPFRYGNNPNSGLIIRRGLKNLRREAEQWLANATSRPMIEQLITEKKMTKTLGMEKAS